MHRLERQKDEEVFGVFAIKTVWDQAGKGNRNFLSVRMVRNWCETELQIVFASPVSFTS